eukprot:SAG31_NODE_1964_length_6799_cov_2.549552_8_plen_484_part_00
MAQRAAEIKKELDSAILGVDKLAGFANELKIVLRPHVQNKRQRLLHRIRNKLAALLDDPWSEAVELPTSGTVVTQLPLQKKRGLPQASREYRSVNITVGATDFGTLVAAITLAERPRYSIDNQTPLPLVYRLASARKRRSQWRRIPNNHTASGTVLDIWEGQAQDIFQIKLVEQSDKDAQMFSLAVIGEQEPWSVEHNSPEKGVEVLHVHPIVVINRGAMTLVLAEKGKASLRNLNITPRVPMKISMLLAGFGASLINDTPQELLHFGVKQVSLQLSPINCITVTDIKARNIKTSPGELFVRMKVDGSTYQDTEVQDFKDNDTDVCWDTTRIVRRGQKESVSYCFSVQGDEELVATIILRSSEGVESTLGACRLEWTRTYGTGIITSSSIYSAGDEVGSLQATITYRAEKPTSGSLSPWGHNTDLINFSIDAIQLDNQIPNVMTPVVLATSEPDVPAPHVQLRVKKSTSQDGGTMQIDKVRVE